METKKASIKREGSNAYLVLELNDQPLQIILTDDNPNNIKSVFNVLLKELKGGLLHFTLDDEVEDLYGHICIEYLAQLNNELQSVYDELKDFGLIADKE